MPALHRFPSCAHLSRAAATTILLAVLAGCGYKGPLYMPPPPAADPTLTTPPPQAAEPAQSTEADKLTGGTDTINAGGSPETATPR